MIAPLDDTSFLALHVESSGYINASIYDINGTKETGGTILNISYPTYDRSIVVSFDNNTWGFMASQGADNSVEIYNRTMAHIRSIYLPDSYSPFSTYSATMNVLDNETFAVFYLNYTSSTELIYAVYNINGTRQCKASVDSTASYDFAASIDVFNNTHAVVGWNDKGASPYKAKIAIYSSSCAVYLSATDVGFSSQSSPASPYREVQVAALTSNTFAVTAYNYNATKRFQEYRAFYTNGTAITSVLKPFIPSTAYTSYFHTSIARFNSTAAMTSVTWHTGGFDMNINVSLITNSGVITRKLYTDPTTGGNQGHNSIVHKNQLGNNISLGGDDFLYLSYHTAAGDLVMQPLAYDFSNATITNYTASGGGNSPPVSLLHSPVDALSTPLQTIEFCTNVSDADSDPLTVTFFIDGSSVNVSTGVSPPTQVCYNQTLSVGVHSWNAQANDGTESVNGTQRTLTILNTAPTLSIASPSNGTLVVNATLPIINITVGDINNNSINVTTFLNGTLIATNLSLATGTVFNLTANLSIVGAYNLTFIAYDGFVNSTVSVFFSYDPTAYRFGTSAVRDLWTTPVTNESFVIAYLGVDESVRYVYYNTTATLIAGPITVKGDVNHTGQGVSNNAVSVTALNATDIIVAYFDLTHASNTSISYKSCKLATSTCSTEYNITSNVNASYAVSVSALNSTHFATAWNDDQDNKTYTAVYKADGTLVGGPTQIQTNLAGNNHDIEVSTQNSTHYAVATIQDGDDDLTIHFFGKTANLIISPANVDSDVGDSFGSSIACYDNNYCVIGWLDLGSGVNDASFAVWQTNGTQTVTEVDADTDTGTVYETIVGVLNTTSHFIMWNDASTDTGLYLAQYYINGTAKGSEVTITDMSIPKFFHATSQTTTTELCDNNYVTAWAHGTFGAGAFRIYKNNNSLWSSGICNTPPTITAASISPTPTATTSQDLLGYCTATDSEGDPLTFTFEWYKNGMLHSTSTNTGVTGIALNVGNISSSLTSEGESWLINCAVTDGQYTDTTTINSTATIINSTSMGDTSGGGGGGGGFFSFLQTQSPTGTTSQLSSDRTKTCYVFNDNPKCSFNLLSEQAIHEAISEDFTIEQITDTVFGKDVKKMNDILITYEGEPNVFYQKQEGIVIVDGEVARITITIFNFKSVGALIGIIGISSAWLLSRRRK